jgi:hypothetical protein
VLPETDRKGKAATQANRPKAARSGDYIGDKLILEQADLVAQS